MTENINICDIIIIIVLLITMAGSYRRGLVRSVFGLCKTIAAIILAGQAYPHITKLLRETGIYSSIDETIKSWLHLGVSPDGTGPVEAVISETLKSQTDFINGLPLPRFMINSLLAGNNSVIYEALNVNGIFDYISGFLTNICINIIGWVAAFIVIIILLELLGNALDLIAKFPVINTFNKLGGLLIGFIQATLFIWVCQAIVVLFFSSPKYAVIGEMMEKSMFAGLFFEYNLILEVVNSFVM